MDQTTIDHGLNNQGLNNAANLMRVVQLNFPSNQYFGNQTPRNEKEAISKSQFSIMVGHHDIRSYLVPK